jgi:cysteine desulfurase
VTRSDRDRVYLDWNATAPLRPEARAAMLAAMDAVGNPSSVHAEGRAARAIVEKARGQVAALVGCEPGEVVFTSGATEAASHLLQRCDQAFGSEIEHDCVWSRIEESSGDLTAGALRIDRSGRVTIDAIVPSLLANGGNSYLCLQSANGETGVLQEVARGTIDPRVVFCDMTQSLGKVAGGASLVRADQQICSGHKIGSAKGVGCLVIAQNLRSMLSDMIPLISGGGQEGGARGGTENVIGIAGFGAAAEAAQRDLEAGVWDWVAKLRDDLEERLASAAPDLHIFGKEAPRLPNTSCFAVPGWRGETQVMQMDLAGFAVSAGSACSSGKVSKASRVLLAMGFDEVTASSAIRVSMGPTTTEAEVMAFADTWIDHYRRRRERAA